MLLALTALVMGCEMDYAPSCGQVNQFAIILVDSCEYLYCTETAGYMGYGYLAHKGNCKFCIERRQKELEELIIKLKEK